MKIGIRDFIYLDTDRLKSIIAQVEKGVLLSSTNVRTKGIETSLSAEGGILGFMKAIGAGNFIWQNQESETKTLHDNIYNKVEDTLITNDILIRVPDNYKEANVEIDKFRKELKDNMFVLLNGKININDFTQVRIIIENFNDLGRFFAQCGAMKLPDSTTKKDRQNYINKIQETIKLDKKILEGFKLIFDVFYKDRVVIKIMPFDSQIDLRFVGNLNKGFLRDDISSITYKYGTAPISKWNIFAQIASIPPKDRSNTEVSMSGSEIETALQKVFDAFRVVELTAQSVVYPEISITPIAIYRE